MKDAYRQLIAKAKKVSDSTAESHGLSDFLPSEWSYIALENNRLALGLSLLRDNLDRLDELIPPTAPEGPEVAEVYSELKNLELRCDFSFKHIQDLMELGRAIRSLCVLPFRAETFLTKNIAEFLEISHLLLEVDSDPHLLHRRALKTAELMKLDLDQHLFFLDYRNTKWILAEVAELIGRLEVDILMGENS